LSARQPSGRDDPPHSGAPGRASGAPAPGLTAAAADLRAGLDAIPGGAVLLSGDLRLVEANDVFAGIIGRPLERLVGESLEELLSIPARILFQTHVYPALLADGRVEEVFLTLASADGPAVPVLLNAARIEGRPGIEYGALVVRIRARSQWELELLDATKALERERAASGKLAAELATTAADLEARYADERRNSTFRDAFVGVISHELRTPITTIFGMSHVLRERHRSMDPDAVTARLEDIESEADRLRRLTEDLLVLSRAEGRRLEIAAEPIVLGHVLRSAVEGEQARAAGHRFVLQVEPDLPLILGDGTYVEQVLRNFLANAVKYSSAGSTVTTIAKVGPRGVEIRVLDEGVGLGDEPSEPLWDLFYRSQEAVNKTGGAGIGLFVSRELIHAMGGGVWSQNRKDGATRGSEFGFWLPAAQDLDEE
jgi:signal transduction histidine kinase